MGRKSTEGEGTKWEGDVGEHKEGHHVALRHDHPEHVTREVEERPRRGEDEIIRVVKRC